MIHLYGVVEELEALPPVAGVGAGPLERCRVEGLDLVVSREARDGGEVTQAALLSHANVVEELMAPVNGGVQCAVAWFNVAQPIRLQYQSPMQPLQQRCRGQKFDPRRDQFNR